MIALLFFGIKRRFSFRSFAGCEPCERLRQGNRSD